MKSIIFSLQFFASKKGVGSTKNGRDSNPKYLGAKLSDGQPTKIGQIIYRQRGTRIYPGKGVGMGVDHTLFALVEGIVKYKPLRKHKKQAIVISSNSNGKKN